VDGGRIKKNSTKKVETITTQGSEVRKDARRTSGMGEEKFPGGGGLVGRKNVC